MKIIKPSVEFFAPVNPDTVLIRLERIGRICYKSEERMTKTSTIPFIQKIIERGHESVLEHCSFTVKFTVDRGVSHELVRHRIASFSQESTRYCNYSKDQFNNEITVIEPCFLLPDTPAYNDWFHACTTAEHSYFSMLDWGYSPQEARTVLPNSLKTEVVMTANIREWRHFFRLRCSSAAHPQMREVAVKLLKDCCALLPELFNDIKKELSL